MTGCGTDRAYPFFISLNIITNYLILNLLAATIIVGYSKIFKEELRIIDKYKLK